MKTKKVKSGMAFHCQPEILIEWCTDFAERLEYIRTRKPQNEIATREKCFKMLSKKAIAALPVSLSKALADWSKARADWSKALANWSKARADLSKADADWSKADADWSKARADWSKALANWDIKEKEKFHAEFCGCTEWNGQTLIFPETIPTD